MRNEAGQISLILTDDHAIVRRGLVALLETQDDIHVVGEAANGTEAVALCREHAPDVVLMDLILPGINGVEATRQIKTVSPRTQVMILTSFHDDEHILPAIRAGALSYLLKDMDPEELIHAIRRAARGEVTLHPRIASHLMLALQANPRTVSHGPSETLSERETEVLRLVAGGLSNAAIAERLVISEKTVKSHVSNILSKLHLADRTQAAVYAWREGIVTR